MSKDWLDIVKGDIEQALEDAEFFLNRLNHFLFENYEQMREDAIDFCGMAMNCLEEAERLLEEAREEAQR